MEELAFVLFSVAFILTLYGIWKVGEKITKKIKERKKITNKIKERKRK